MGALNMTASELAKVLGRYNQIKADHDASEHTDKHLESLCAKLNEFTKDELMIVAANIQSV